MPNETVSLHFAVQTRCVTWPFEIAVHPKSRVALSRLLIRQSRGLAIRSKYVTIQFFHFPTSFPLKSCHFRQMFHLLIRCTLFFSLQNDIFRFHEIEVAIYREILPSFRKFNIRAGTWVWKCYSVFFVNASLDLGSRLYEFILIITCLYVLMQLYDLIIYRIL